MKSVLPKTSFGRQKFRDATGNSVETGAQRFRIGFVAGTLGQGGAERQLFHILKVLRGCGAHPYVLCLRQGEFWESRIRALGVPVHYVGASPSRLVRLLRIMFHVQGDPVDILQSQHFYTNLYVAAASRWFGIPGIGAMRNDGASEMRANGRIAGWLDLHGNRFIAANSTAAIQFALGQGISDARLQFLPNVVDTDTFQPREIDWTLESREPTLLIVGRLVEQKRIDRFVDILWHVRRCCSNTRGIIVGVGALQPALERQAAQLNLFPHAIEFRRHVSYMPPVYHEADICVLTSDHEGTPNALLEAMSCGIPVVSTKVGGVPKIVREGETGFLVNPTRPQEMVKAILVLINDPALRREMGARARSFVEACHSLHRLSVSLKKLYRAALAVRPSMHPFEPHGPD